MQWLVMIETLVQLAVKAVKDPAVQALWQQVMALLSQIKAKMPRKATGAPTTMGDLIGLIPTDAAEVATDAAAVAAAQAAAAQAAATQTADIAARDAALAVTGPIYQINEDGSITINLPPAYTIPTSGVMTALPPTTPIPTPAP